MTVLGNARSIISTKATRGENRYMLEEVYFSDIVQEDEAINNIHQASSTPNPYRAYKDASGYFHYQFPSLWYTSTCNNKAIGLRRIETRARAKNMTFILFVGRKLQADNEPKVYPKRFNLHFLPSDDIDTIMSTMCYEFNNFIKSQLEKSTFTARNRCYTFTVHYKYDDSTNEAMFYAIRNQLDENGDQLDWENVDTGYYIATVNEDFKTCFNITGDIDNYHEGVDASTLGIASDLNDYQTMVYKFSNVFNRRYCFIHASFVSGTSFNYLGRSGDFYTKPSKMYKATGNTTDFTLAISFNGWQPIKTNEVSFIVELAYIYAQESYLAE